MTILEKIILCVIFIPLTFLILLYIFEYLRDVKQIFHKETNSQLYSRIQEELAEYSNKNRRY